MSNLVISTYCNAQSRIATRTDRGSQSAEYGTVILVAVALGLACLKLVTSGAADGALSDMLVSVLKKATSMAK